MKSILKGKSGRVFEITELALTFKDGDLTISSEVLSFYVVDKSLKCASGLFEFDLTLTTQEANWLSQELQDAKTEREPIVVAECEWLTLQPQLLSLIVQMIIENRPTIFHHQNTLNRNLKRRKLI